MSESIKDAGRMKITTWHEQVTPHCGFTAAKAWVAEARTLDEGVPIKGFGATEEGAIQDLRDRLDSYHPSPPEMKKEESK